MDRKTDNRIVAAKKTTWAVTVKGYGHHSVTKIRAHSQFEAVRLAQEKYGISVEAHQIDPKPSE